MHEPGPAGHADLAGSARALASATAQNLLDQSLIAIGAQICPTHAQPPGMEVVKYLPCLQHSWRATTRNHSALMKISHALITAALISLSGTTVALAAPAAENWENHCTKCHGADGKGQTKAGKKLQVKDYTEAKVQAEMKDAEMLKATA